jgi:hypothetical protein
LQYVDLRSADRTIGSAAQVDRFGAQHSLEKALTRKPGGIQLD